MSVTKGKGESVSILGRTAATEYAGKREDAGRSAATGIWNGEIVTPPITPSTAHRNPEPVVPKRVRFQGLDESDGGPCIVRPERDAGGGLLVEAPDARVPSYDEACKSLAQHLAFVGQASYGTWRDFLLDL